MPNKPLARGNVNGYHSASRRPRARGCAKPMRTRSAILIACALLYGGVCARAGEPTTPQRVRARSRHLRIDVTWERAAEEPEQVEIQRSFDGESFRTVFTGACAIPVYADHLGRANVRAFYRVRRHTPARGFRHRRQSAWSLVAHGHTRASTPDELLTEVQEAGVRFFYDYGHPRSGLARERSHALPRQCATGATGMGLFNLAVGVERGLLPRPQAAARVLKILRFLSENTQRYHGAWSHWIDGETGRTWPFSTFDDGADLVETAFLAQGLLFAREYFGGNTTDERAVRRLADRLWREIEWDWFLREWHGRRALMWHWSPRHEWKMDLPIRGFNECQIVYILAMASPTHPVPASCYETGWHHPRYATPREHFGIALELNHGITPPLFFTHYSYLGFDPHAIRYRGRSYFDRFRDLCRVQIRYAAAQQNRFDYYGRLWGLTASMDPEGYSTHRPGTARDNGTIAPTAALASMPYVPDESSAFLQTLYRDYAATTWDAFGFRDALNPARQWIAPGLLGIDAGPIAPMIENHRTGLCWNTFMRAPEIRRVVAQLNATDR